MIRQLPVIEEHLDEHIHYDASAHAVGGDQSRVGSGSVLIGTEFVNGVPILRPRTNQDVQISDAGAIDVDSDGDSDGDGDRDNGLGAERD